MKILDSQTQDSPNDRLRELEAEVIVLREAIRTLVSLAPANQRSTEAMAAFADRINAACDVQGDAGRGAILGALSRLNLKGLGQPA